MSEDELIAAAWDVLQGNWRGTYTRPSPELYPHQWNWDSGFVSIGYAHFAPKKAFRELGSLFRAQWHNGMVPHIVFSPAATTYFPGPDFWDVDRAPAAPRGVQTSGITQPPVHATAALHVYRKSTDGRAKDFLRAIFPNLTRQQRYFYGERDPAREGLAFIRHPWESGTDNSPVWDEPLGRIDSSHLASLRYQRRDAHFVSAEQRPTTADYDRYVYLVELSKASRYDEAALAGGSPFLIQDPLFNALLCRANEDLIEIAELLGEDAGRLREWHEQTKQAIDRKLWNEEHALYCSYDLTEGRQLPADSISGFAPLFAGVPDSVRADRLLRRLESPGFAGRRGECFRIPTYDMESAVFDPVRYWRGPVWVNMDWLIYHGLERYGFHESAERVRGDVLELVSRFGFYEYFSPFRTPRLGKTGGLGGSSFSWTAALYIDLAAQGAG